MKSIQQHIADAVQKTIDGLLVGIPTGTVSDHDQIILLRVVRVLRMLKANIEAETD